MNDKMISIVVPVYNAEKYILDTIAMVQKQTYTDWELLLVEDCSKDSTRTILEEFEKKNQDSRIRIIYLKKNSGAASARNTGTEKAEGRYLAFLDADDVWKPEKLAAELEFMRKKDAAFVYTAYEFGDENGRGTGKYVTVKENLSYKEALSRTIIFTSTTMFDLKKLDKNMLLMPEVPSEDTATWWQILKTGIKAQGLQEVTTIYRRPQKSLSSNKGKAILRIWNLYRNVEHLSIIKSVCCFVPWAYRATVRRL